MSSELRPAWRLVAQELPAQLLRQWLGAMPGTAISFEKAMVYRVNKAVMFEAPTTSESTVVADDLMVLTARGERGAVVRLSSTST